MQLNRLLLTSILLSIDYTVAYAQPPILPGDAKLSLKAQLGKQLFFDSNLSEPAGQSCSTCHSPATAFTDPDKSKPTSKGVNPELHGNRNTPTVMYAAYSPSFHFDKQAGLYIGGQFLDGRAANLTTQAKGPFLNALEMANPDKATVVNKVKIASYANLFKTVYGYTAFNDNEKAYNQIADAIATFERSLAFNQFSSKYDFYLFGKATFTPQEQRGRKVFEDGNKGNCASCHPSRPNSNGTPPLFTDFSYDNIGIPKTPDNPFYDLLSQYNPDGFFFTDLGLGGALHNPSEDGKFKVPTLRNIALTSPYSHNGYFKTLSGIISFYNTRDTKTRCKNTWTTEAAALAQNCWPAPETITNVNHLELGHLRLNNQDINDLIAFLKTLTDGYKAYSPWTFNPPVN